MHKQVRLTPETRGRIQFYKEKRFPDQEELKIRPGFLLGLALEDELIKNTNIKEWRYVLHSLRNRDDSLATPSTLTISQSTWENLSSLHAEFQSQLKVRHLSETISMVFLRLAEPANAATSEASPPLEIDNGEMDDTEMVAAIVRLILSGQREKISHIKHILSCGPN